MSKNKTIKSNSKPAYQTSLTKSYTVALTNLDITSWEEFSEYIKLNKNLRHLKLYSNHISYKESKILEELLKSTKKLKKITFVFNDITYKAIQIIAKTLETHKTISFLEFYQNQLYLKGVPILAQSIKNNTNLKSIKISSTIANPNNLKIEEIQASLIKFDSINSAYFLISHSLSNLFDNNAFNNDEDYNFETPLLGNQETQ